MSRARPRPQARLFGAIAFLGSLLLTLLVLEIGFRAKAYYDDRELDAFGRLGTERVVDDPNTRVLTANIIRLSPDPRIIYELIPGVHATYKGAIIRINEDGFRGERLREQREPGEVRIFGLGDSVMFGWGVAEDAYYLRLLADRLAREHPNARWNVINTAVPGYNTAMEVATLKRKLLRYEPDLVLIHYVDNDRGLPNFIRNRAPYLARNESFLWHWIYYTVRRGFHRMPDDRLAQPDRDPGAAVPAAYADMVGTEGYARAMRELAALRDANGFAVRVISNNGFPPEVEQIATSLGFALIDGRDAAAAHLASLGLGIEDYARSDLVLSNDDPHPSELGHRIFADALYDALEGGGLLSKVEEKARARTASDTAMAPITGTLSR